VLPWETLYVHSLQDKRWFEPLERWTSGDAHLAVYRQFVMTGWSLQRHGLWYVAKPPDGELRPQGWKLHVTALDDNSVDVLRTAIPILRERGVFFKFLLDPAAVALTTGKVWPRSSSGKFITVYPDDEEAFRSLATELSEALRPFSGPYILSDRRCPDSKMVYYRYGGFVRIAQVRADGFTNFMIAAPDGSLHRDVREPYFNAPSWITQDPFGKPADADDDDEDGLLAGRYEISEVLRSSNRGGVYLGRDTTTDREVVLKEARPNIRFNNLDLDIDAVAALRKEHRLLVELADTGYFATPIEVFEEWEHTFLVEENFSGPQLSQVSLKINPLYTLAMDRHSMAAYYGRMRNLFVQLATAVQEAHRRTIVLGDLSWTNVLVDEDTDRLIIIDLEAAVKVGIDDPLRIYTRGVTSQRSINTGIVSAEDDVYAVGSILMGSILLVNSYLGYRPEAVSEFLGELSKDLALPADLVELVKELTAPPTGTTIDAGALAQRLSALTVGDPLSWPETIPLSEAASTQMVGERAEAVRKRAAETVDGIVDYVHATATVHRSDRLFPGDVGTFVMNPLCISHGAAGVLHALHRLSGDVPGRYAGWVLRRDIDCADYSPGLYHGLSGIAWVLAELGQVDFAVRLLREAGQHPLAFDGFDVMNGAAGRGMAALRLWQITNQEELLGEAIRVGSHLARTGLADDAGVHWQATTPTGERHVPLGYGYGASGVALFLLYLHLATGDDAMVRLGRRALDFDLAHAVQHNERMVSFRGDRDEGRDPNLRSYWDLGTAGVMTTLARYHVAAGDPVIDSWIDRLLPDICRKYAMLPQLFHGLAGFGNALIDVAELTGRPEALAEAWRTAEGVLLYRIECPEGIGFPGEQAMRESADFATGSAGIGLFLNRLINSRPGIRSNFNFVLDDLLPGPGPDGT